MSTMPTPFLFKKAEMPKCQLRELREPDLQEVSGGAAKRNDGGGCSDPVNTLIVRSDGTSDWCTTDDCP